MLRWYGEILTADQWGKITLLVMGLFFGAVSVLIGIGIALVNFLGVVWAAALALITYFSIVLLFPVLVTGISWFVTKCVELSGQNVRKGD